MPFFASHGSIYHAKNCCPKIAINDMATSFEAACWKQCPIDVLELKASTWLDYEFHFG